MCPPTTARLQHGSIHRLIAEVIDELGIRTRTIAVAPVGCAVSPMSTSIWMPARLPTAGTGHGDGPETGAA